MPPPPAPSPSISPLFTSLFSVPVDFFSLNPNPSSFHAIHLLPDPAPAITTTTTTQTTTSFSKLLSFSQVLTLFRQGLLQRFQNPTIFLKISCDGDYVLPIVVGKIAVEKLIDAEVEQENRDFPDQFQFVKNLIERLDHEVIMVRITERVVSTYFARLYLSQPGKSDIISVDLRPSDAINVANICKAPIYVSKEIVFTDAIRLGYGMGRVQNKKAIYDVLLDSPIDGPDSVAQELSMMHNMHLAIKQERFKDAGGDDRVSSEEEHIWLSFPDNFSTGIY
ncbi:bifunctional nuclease 2-like protein [Trifolium pratense]|uniref:Bifunctional nuclease 2-like protein n=1 Tax=Trifolium pratense TaxID=57577 RepID=A0A2K3PIL3_TRIPR|nr:bifunctional nuclease 2-like protein [Trifolium pratense]